METLAAVAETDAVSCSWKTQELVLDSEQWRLWFSTVEEAAVTDGDACWRRRRRADGLAEDLCRREMTTAAEERELTKTGGRRY